MDAAVDAALKEVTPFENKRYCPKNSTVAQIEMQKQILTQAATEKNLIFAEVDEFERLRYIILKKNNYALNNF